MRNIVIVVFDYNKVLLIVLNRLLQFVDMEARDTRYTGVTFSSNKKRIIS